MSASESVQAPAVVAEEPVGPSDPSLSQKLESIPKEKLIGERMVIIGLSPIVPLVVEAELESIYAKHKQQLDPDSGISPLVAERIVAEIELLARMSNPESSYRPEWYDVESDETLINDILERNEFKEDFDTELVEIYGVPEDVAEDIIQYVRDHVYRVEQPIITFYAQSK